MKPMINRILWALAALAYGENYKRIYETKEVRQ